MSQNFTYHTFFPSNQLPHCHEANEEELWHTIVSTALKIHCPYSLLLRITLSYPLLLCVCSFVNKSSSKEKSFNFEGLPPLFLLLPKSNCTRIARAQTLV